MISENALLRQDVALFEAISDEITLLGGEVQTDPDLFAFLDSQARAGILLHMESMASVLRSQT